MTWIQETADGLLEHPTACECDHPRCVEARGASIVEAVAGVEPVTVMPQPIRPLELDRVEPNPLEAELHRALAHTQALEAQRARARADDELARITARHAEQSARLRRETAAKAKAMELLWKALEAGLRAAPHLLEQLGDQIDDEGRMASWAATAVSYARKAIERWEHLR